MSNTLPFDGGDSQVLVGDTLCWVRHCDSCRLDVSGEWGDYRLLRLLLRRLLVRICHASGLLVSTILSLGLNPALLPHGALHQF